MSEQTEVTAQRTGPAPVYIRRLLATEGVLYQQLQLEAMDDAPHAFGPIRERIAGVSGETLDRQAEHYATDSREAVFLALRRAALLGTASVHCEGGKPWLSFVWVRPAWRKTGLAQALLAHVGRWCGDAGERSLYARVLDENPRALRFYQREGWWVVGQEPWPSRPTRVRFVICRHLNGGIA